MQIIIPMSGSGERFRRAGYALPKPLIEVEGKPILAHVIALFPGATDFVFICNQEHLARFKMAETIRRYCPAGKIVGIAPHKLGPVHAVLQAAEHIKPDEPVLVSYCDYSAVWDFAAFEKFVAQNECDGAVIGYTGFHPHMLRNHNYGYVRMQGDRVADIREKQPYTDRPMQEIALCGAYYFRDGRTMLDAMRELEKHDELRMNGEHYVSLAYKSLLAKGADIRTFLVEHFMQWGTPEDLQDYLYWSAIFRDRELGARAKHPGYVVMPMAGEGRRFAEAGYKDPKPLIAVGGKPMAVRAWENLPKTPHVRVVLRRDLPQVQKLENELPKTIPNLDIVMLEQLSEGQALSALAGLEGIGGNEMVTIAACDNGFKYDAETLNALFDDPEVDVIVWGARGHPPAMCKPNAYGWVDADETGKIKNVSVKAPLNDPAHDAIVTGAFTFRRADDFRLCVKHMMEREARVNGEFYIDTAINDAIELGLNCRLFVVDHYLGWGTPEELETYNYWQDCFRKTGVSLSLVIPCYNEAQSLPGLIERCREVVAQGDIEIILVDNGSRDDTPRVLEEATRGQKHLRTTRVETNQGYGFGILCGLRVARGDILAWTHADMQTDPMDALRGLNVFKQHSGEEIFVKGRRYGRTMADVFFTFGMSCFESVLFLAPFWDINGQPVLFPRALFESWKDPPHDFALDLYAYWSARRLGYKIRRFPVRFGRRQHGQSRWNINWQSRFRMILRVIGYSWQLRRKFVD